jgi:NAD(P)-dependent dehydrogenase (short-subunit alcohol dehydrogenase family)
MDTALIIGNSDGIGLALTRQLLDRTWQVVGISRSPSPVEHTAYQHVVMDVTNDLFAETIAQALEGVAELKACFYCAGTGSGLDLDDLSADVKAFDVNLMGLLRTAAQILPRMKQQGEGRFVALSSLADVLRGPDSPAYAASKAAMSSYLEGVARAYRPHGVYVTNVRFGFVDTKMADAPLKPLMITAERAAEILVRLIPLRCIRYSYPRRMAWVAWLVGSLQDLKIRLKSWT